MSLATLARKTRAKQRVKTRGKFVLNMTGRGTVSHKTNRGPCGLKYNKTGTSKCTFRGSNATCCNDNSKCKQFPHGGVPAPQMGYGIYLNKKNHGGYRPSGGKCCKNSEAQKNAKIVWKKSPDTDASDLIRRRKDKVLACNNDVYSQSKNKKVCLVKKNMCGCNSTDKVDYTRINHNWCTTTKAIPQNRTAGEQIARNRAVVSNECVCTYKGPLTDGPTEQCGTIRWAVNQYFSTIPHGRKFSKGGIYNQYGIIEEWDTSLITNMDGLFKDRSTFNKNLGQWNLTNVTSVREMFYGASSFNNDTISASALPPPSSMLQSNAALSSASAQPSLNDWDVSQVTDMGFMFTLASAFNQDIGLWDVSNVRDMAFMFYGAYVFNQDIGSWDVGNVTNMAFMFQFATIFNQDIGLWDVSNVRDMALMFYGASVFNQDIGSWERNSDPNDISTLANVTDMQAMFSRAYVFNQDIGSWNVGNVINMSAMFYGAYVFNQDIGSWNVGNVIDMSLMFPGAYVFNQDIGSWNVGNVINMSYMFNDATAFNNGGVGGLGQGLDKWDVRNVINMALMFYGASVFNQDIGSWERNSDPNDISTLANVTDMQAMFSRAYVFNQDIGSWNVSNVTNMASMFASAQSFNNGGVGGENIGLDKWDVSNVTNMGSMLRETSFFHTLQSWPTNPSGTGSGFATGLTTELMFNMNPLLSRGIPETPSTDTAIWQGYNWP